MTVIAKGRRGEMSSTALRAVVMMLSWKSSAFWRRAERQVGCWSGGCDFTAGLVRFWLIARIWNRDRRWRVAPVSRRGSGVSTIGSVRRARKRLRAPEWTLASVLDVCPLSAFLDDLEVVVQDRRNNRHHVRFHYSCTNGLRAAYANIDYTLERQIPLPHLHHVFTPTLLENAYQPLDTAIDGEYISYSTRGCREVCQVVE